MAQNDTIQWHAKLYKAWHGMSRATEPGCWYSSLHFLPLSPTCQLRQSQHQHCVTIQADFDCDAVLLMQSRLVHQISASGNGAEMYIDRSTLQARLSEVRRQNSMLQVTADNAMEMLHTDPSSHASRGNARLHLPSLAEIDEGSADPGELRKCPVCVAEH